MTSDDDSELEWCEDHGLDAIRIDGVVHARWDDRWLPVDLGDDPPLPVRTTLISASVDPGAGFMADEATYELAKVDDETLVHITRIDGLGTEVQLEPFEPGTEEQAIESFMEDMRDLEPEAVELEDDAGGDEGDVRTLSFWRP